MYNLLIGFDSKQTGIKQSEIYYKNTSKGKIDAICIQITEKGKKFYRHKYPSLKINHNVDSRSLDLRKTSIQVI